MLRISLVAIAIAAVVLMPSAARDAHSQTAGLTVRLVSDGIDSSKYPELGFTITVTDHAGRAPGGIVPADVSAPGAEIISVTETTAPSVRGAYVIAIDASASMTTEIQPGVTRLDYARSLARLFLGQLAPTDRVTVVQLGGNAPGMDAVIRSGWTEPANPLVNEGISTVTPAVDLNMANALVSLTAIAGARPPEIERASVFLISDVDAVGKSGGLSADLISAKLGTPLYIASLREANSGRDLDLKTLFTSSASLTGGAFIGPDGDIESAIDGTRRALDVVVSDGTRPNGEQNDLVLSIIAAGSSGVITHHYRSGLVLDVTDIAVEGMDKGETITSDRPIVASIEGGERWAYTRIDLFRDCDPNVCRELLATAEDSPLRHRVAASPLSQGEHYLVFRVTARDADGREFVDSLVFPFAREGTSYNVPLVLAMLCVIVATVALAGAWARRQPRSRGLT